MPMIRARGNECRQVAKVLQSYLDGESPQKTSEMVAAHLETCRKCGLEASTYRAIKESIAKSQPAGPKDDQALVRLREFVDDLASSGEA